MFNLVYPAVKNIKTLQVNEKTGSCSEQFLFIKTTEDGYLKLLRKSEEYIYDETFMTIPGFMGFEYIIVVEKYKLAGWAGEIMETSFPHTMRCCELDDKYPNFLYDLIFNQGNPYRTYTDVEYLNLVASRLSDEQEAMASHLDDISYEVLCIEDVEEKYPELLQYLIIHPLEIICDYNIIDFLERTQEKQHFMKSIYINTGFQDNSCFIPKLFLTEHVNHSRAVKEIVSDDLFVKWCKNADAQYAFVRELEGHGLPTDGMRIATQACCPKYFMSINTMLTFAKHITVDIYRHSNIEIIITNDILNILEQYKYIDDVNAFFDKYARRIDVFRRTSKIQLNMFNNRIAVFKKVFANK